MFTFESREIVPLDGIWSFRFTEGGALEDAAPQDGQYDDIMPVPAVFDLQVRYLRKRGLACYRRTFRLAAPCPAALLRVDGIGLCARFWIDGAEVGTADMAYNPYVFKTGALDAGTHVIEMAIDNRLSKNTPFFKPNYDFYAHGGVYRSLSLEALPEGIALDRIQVRTLDYHAGKVSLRVLLRGCTSPRKVSAFIRFDTDDAPRAVTLDAAPTPLAPEGEATLEMVVPKHRLWSPKTPALHTLTCSLADSGDTLAETFGIRDIRTSGGKLYLNGEPLWLLGFNRHESHPELGPVLPESVMLTDLEHMRELGCNFVRGAHYPQDPRFLDLCDRFGFLVWEEGLAWGNEAPVLSDPVFIDGQIAQMRRMVRQSVNHPSVIIWAFLNEFDSGSDAGVSLCRRLVDTLKEEDASRLVTFACNRGGNDRCSGMVDLVSFNTYPGWCWPEAIEQEPEEMISAAIESNIRHFLKIRKPDAPIIVSEMGCCGIYGTHDDAAAQWTEEFELRYVRASYEAAVACPEIQGFTVWQLNDCYSYHRKGGSLRGKPFGQNLAGAFDIYRRRKLAGYPGALFSKPHP